MMPKNVKKIKKTPVKDQYFYNLTINFKLFKKQTTSAKDHRDIEHLNINVHDSTAVQCVYN